MSDVYSVTGATGFIGYKLARRLVESGAKVRCLVRSTSKRDALKALGVEFIDGDLNDRSALERCANDVRGIFHLAGLTREARRGDFERVNTEGTKNLANAIVSAGSSRQTRAALVYVSSLAGAGIAPKAGEGERYGSYRLRVETDASSPLSPYGRSKAKAELALQSLADKLATTTIRPPYVFGEGDSLSLPLFRMAKRKGLFVMPGWLDNYYSFVYVDDLVETLVAAMDRGERLTSTSLAVDKERCLGTGVYFAASGKPLRFSDFGKAIGRSFGRDKLFLFRTPPVGVYGTGIYGECYKRICRRPAPLDWNKAIEAMRGPWICSAEKAKEQLGVSFDQDLQPKIERTARWYEEQNLC